MRGDARISQKEVFEYSAVSVQHALTRIMGDMSQETLREWIFTYPERSECRRLLVRLSSLVELYLPKED